jgi:hypothetical protein
MSKNIYVPPKKNQFALLSNDDDQDKVQEPTLTIQQNHKLDEGESINNRDVDFKVYYTKNTKSYPRREEGNYPRREERNYPRREEGNYPRREERNYPRREEENYPKREEGEWQYQKNDNHRHGEQLKYIYLEVPENIRELKMNNYYRLLAHHNADSNWNFNSYHHVTTLKTWEDISKLFNTLNLTNYKSNIGNFDFFIMKNEISPLWEDEENRCGSICSIKIDTLKDGYNILKTIFFNVCNNTLMNISKNNVPNWNIINGVSFSCKKIENVSSTVEQDYSMIKIWFKTNYTQFDNIDKYFNDDINALLKKYSIKVRAIKPEY